ncbi:MAG: SPFH domain-containing protein [Clostridia bacterium]|nr:SPFH domain-containing protein [Clostridia bacterium]
MRKKIGLFGILAIIIVFVVALSSCRKPYDKPELVTIEPSQTAFLIPLDGKTSAQSEFMSEKFLLEAKVATKQVQIPHRWLQEGRWPNNGRWIPSARLIVVERKPETREWTENDKTGTSIKNEGIVAESKESIGFMARMNCSAQIDEGDAVRFLYRYNNKSLADVMDTEIRARIESSFVEQCSKYTLDEILQNKDKIMGAVRDNVVLYFKERGISITVIGLKGEFTYLNEGIQEAIDNKFKSSQALITQKNENERVLSKAKADAEAVKIQTETINQSIRLKELEVQSKAIEKWDGKMPEYIGGNSGSIFNIPVK